MTDSPKDTSPDEDGSEREPRDSPDLVPPTQEFHTPPTAPIPPPYPYPQAGAPDNDAPAGSPPPPPPPPPPSGAPYPYGAGQPPQQPPAGQQNPYGGQTYNPQPGYYAPPPNYYATGPRRTNVSAVILTIVSGILTFTCYFTLAGIPGLVLGILGLTKQYDDPEGSRRMTRIGWIVVAAVSAVIIVVLVIGLLALFSTFDSGIMY